MKKIWLYFALIIMFSCGNETEKNIETDKSIESDTVKVIDPIKEDTIQDEVYDKENPIDSLLNFCDENLKNSLQLYISLISEDIKSEAQIRKAFELRKKILYKLDNAVSNYLISNNEDYNNELEVALNSIGFQGVYAEGMYMTLGVYPVLEDAIRKVASDEFKLTIDFYNALSASIGGEYPYATMSDEMEVVRIGEKIRSEYPDTDSIKNITEHFMQNLFCFTDFHVVVDSKNRDSAYIVWGTDVYMYPGMSSKYNFEDFYKKMPDSKYSKIVKSVCDAPSIIYSDEGSSIYLVAVHVFDNYSSAEQQIFEYFEKGIDIPHRIIIRENGNISYAVVYRFFSEKKKANDALNYIKRTNENAKIITIDLAGNVVN
ncbi:MAG: hypothetical protein L3J35_09880 [Bacteroidales bacterium]|nr:hypothetical protein [Bacteroidales bacterium]